MGENRGRSNPIGAAGEVASGLVESVVKDAVVEAMQEVESEEGSSGSKRRIVSGLLLLGVGFVLGALLVKRRVRSQSRFEEGIEEADSARADTTGEDESEAEDGDEEEEEEAVDASATE